MLETASLFCLVRITPEKVEDLLMVLGVVDAELDLEWSLNLLNGLDVLNSWTNSSMAAEDSLVLVSDNSSQWHLLECLVDLHEDTVWVVDILTESLSTLISESKVLVDMLVLVVSSKQHDLLWVLKLKGKQETYDLKTVLALVDVVAEEEIVVSVNVTGVRRSLPNVEESHKVLVLAHKISDNLHRGSELLDDDWLSS